MNIALIGSGGREHALCQKIYESNLSKDIICIPGNAGTSEIAKNVSIDFLNFKKVLEIIKLYKIENKNKNIFYLTLATMLSYLLPLVSISSFSTEITYRSNSSVDVNYDKTNLIQMIKKINHGNRVVHDMCESLEEKYSFISGSNKPSCRFKVSYINKTNINLYKIKEEVRNFIITEKKLMCKDEKIECGSLTVILKILDLVNAAIDVSINMNDFVINIELIEFDVLFDTYISALDNMELLTNITLSRTK